eukprot:gene2584-3294_t
MQVDTPTHVKRAATAATPAGPKRQAPLRAGRALCATSVSPRPGHA